MRNIKKELLKQKKKLLIYTVATMMGTTSLVGCGNKFEYEKDSTGVVNITGTMDYVDVKNLKFVHLTNEIAKLDRYYLVKCGYYRYPHYIDIETDRIIYQDKSDDYENFNLEIVVDNMLDYLYKYDMVKDEYTIDDINKLEQLLLNDETLELENNKISSNILKRKKIYV